jgi:tRNA threonylcarbamoyladenosine biosynthesis protein TsaE
MTGVARRRVDSAEETEALGERLAPLLEVGDLVLLSGALGAGKTRLVAGLARGLGAPGRVRSPTYTLVSEYSGRVPLVHVDLYRLPEPVDPLPLGLDEYRERAAVVVEWGERLPAAWKADALEVTLGFAGAERRLVQAQGRGARGEALARAWTCAWAEP